jgi:hypothetical protein
VLILKRLSYLVSVFLIVGCQTHLTGTPLDLTPFGAIFGVVGFFYWALAAACLFLAITKSSGGKGRTVAVLIVIAIFSYLPISAIWEDWVARSNLAEAKTRFIELCDKYAEESAPARPFEINFLYIQDITRNVGAGYQYSGSIFDDYAQSIWYKKYIEKSKLQLAMISSQDEIVKAPGSYLLTRTALQENAVGQIRYRGARQEIIDTVTGEVKASRTNFYLGSDYSRGTSCLDSNWSEGFRSFIVRSIGFTPGYSSDAWIREIPSQFVRADLHSRIQTNAADFNAPIRPDGSVYDYNDRKIVIDGVDHYLRQTFNNEPLSLVGVQLFSERVLIAYSTSRWAPSVLVQIRNKRSGQLLQEMYIKIPIGLHRKTDKAIYFHPWRIAKEGVSFKNGRISFDIIQMENEGYEDDPKSALYFRYALDAPWETEVMDRADLPAYLDDGQYGRFRLSNGDVAAKATESQIVGRWVSHPSGVLWDFTEDKSLKFEKYQKWQWQVNGDVLTASQLDVAGRSENASFRLSRDGLTMEVTLHGQTREYEPFLLTKVR